MIQALRTDRKAALKELHGRFSDVLYRYAYRIVKDRVIAEDILQETFLRFYNTNASFTQMSDVQAYLFRSIRNNAFRHLRNEQIRKRAIERADRSTLPEDIDTRYVDAELTRLVFMEIQNMPPDYRQLVELVLLENLDNTALADRLNLSPEAVRLRKHRAVEWLRVAILKKRLTEIPGIIPAFCSLAALLVSSGPF